MLILFEPACRYVWEPFQVFNVEFDPYFDPNSDINDLKIGPNQNANYGGGYETSIGIINTSSLHNIQSVRQVDP